MAILGESTKTLHPWVKCGSRREGSCTTRRKKTMLRQRRKWKTVAEILAEVNAELEAQYGP